MINNTKFTLDYYKINKIYQEYILPKQSSAYLNKYNKNNVIPHSTHKNKDFARIIALYEFVEFIEKYDKKFLQVCSFNGIDDPEIQYIQYEKIFNYFYEKNAPKTDLISLDLDDKKFDFFMVNQTLEHVYDPCLAMRNIYNHVTDGGLVYFNVPCNGIPHDTPHHFYNGFTPISLGCMVEQAGFNILDIGFWGNKEYILKMFSENTWPDYSQLNDYKNDVNYPVIGWVFARR